MKVTKVNAMSKRGGDRLRVELLDLIRWVRGRIGGG